LLRAVAHELDRVAAQVLPHLFRVVGVEDLDRDRSVLICARPGEVADVEYDAPHIPARVDAAEEPIRPKLPRPWLGPGAHAGPRVDVGHDPGHVATEIAGETEILAPARPGDRRRGADRRCRAALAAGC